MAKKKGKKKHVTVKKGATRTRSSRKTTKGNIKGSRKTSRKKLTTSNSRAGTKRIQKTKRKTNRKIQKPDFTFRKYEKTIYSVGLEQHFRIKNYQIKFSQENYIDMKNLENQNTDVLYGQLEPYFTKIYSKIRKHPIYFITKILYFDLFEDAISHSRSDIVMMPDEFYEQAKKLCSLMVSKAMEYEKRAGGTGLDVTGIEFQTYFNPNSRNKKKKKKVKKKK